jgi:predicted amino acid-binding ACT domain protein
VEQHVVSGIAYSRDEAKVSIRKVKDQPGVSASIFGPLAEADISVDMIVQNVSTDGTNANITFTVARKDLRKAIEVLNGVKDKVGFLELNHSADVAKVSIVGIGMRSHAGVAAKMFRVLAEKGINIQAITTSEIKVSVLIDQAYTDLALRSLHQAYGLEVRIDPMMPGNRHSVMTADRGQAVGAGAADGDVRHGPRVLLRRLREVMAEPVTAQKRLDKIATLIAANMVAEVCSIYVMRTGNVLELFATEGLKREAVHKSRLKMGEGLVGTIAEQAIGLNLDEAQAHPAFKYLPRPARKSTILPRRADHAVGTVIGVLVCRTAPDGITPRKKRRRCRPPPWCWRKSSPGRVARSGARVAADVAHMRSHHLRGDSLAEGVALGHAVLHEPRVVIQNLIAEDIPKEKRRIEEAVVQLRAHVDALVDGSESERGGDYTDVLETIRMFAHDKGWLGRLSEAVDTGLTAEGAVERVQNDNRARMQRTPIPICASACTISTIWRTGCCAF